MGHRFSRPEPPPLPSYARPTVASSSRQQPAVRQEQPAAPPIDVAPEPSPVSATLQQSSRFWVEGEGSEVTDETGSDLLSLGSPEMPRGLTLPLAPAQPLSPALRIPIPLQDILDQGLCSLEEEFFLTYPQSLLAADDEMSASTSPPPPAIVDDEEFVLGGDDDEMSSGLSSAPSRLSSPQQQDDNPAKKTKLQESKARLAASKRKGAKIKAAKEANAAARASRTTRSRTEGGTAGPLDAGLGGRKRLARQETGRNKRSRR